MSRRLLLAALACAVASIAVIGPASADAAAQCGSRIAKSSGGYWACTFADDFGRSTLDRSKWAVMKTAESGFSHAFECYVDDPSTVSVANGSLRLTARRLPSPT